MKRLARAALAMVVATPMGALAQAPDGAPTARAGGKPHAPGEGLRRADTNQDGKVSFEELHAMRPELTPEAFSKLDVDRDGFLSATDRPKQPNNARGQEQGEARMKMIQKLLESDANKDGQVSFAELTAAKPGFTKQDFDRLDRNSDGFITVADRPQPPKQGDRPKKPGGPHGARSADNPAAREEFRKRLLAADTDRDGKVSMAEAKTAFPKMTEERFNVLDRNKDGGIGPEDRPQGAAQRKGNTPPNP